MGWRDTQAKVESGALNFRRSARSNSDYFFDAATSSFSDAFRTRKAEEAEADRYKRNRKDQLEDYDRTLADQMAKEKRDIARENEKIRLKKLEDGLKNTAAEENIVKKRRKLATKLLNENGRDATNPNFMNFAMEHLSAYGDNFEDASTKFTDLNKRILEVGPAQGPTLSGEPLDSISAQMEDLEDATADRIAFDAPNPNADFKFENLKKDTYLGAAQDAENGGNLELAQQIRDYGEKAFSDKAKATKLTDSDYASLYADYTRDRSSNDPVIQAAAEKWFKEEEPSLRKGLEAAKSIGKKPAKGEIVYVMTKGRRILARKDDENNYIPIDPNFGDKILKADVDRVDTEDNIAVLQKSLNAVSTQTKAQRDKMNSATTVAKEGYDITQMVKKTPIVLTIVGSARTAIGGVRQEADALFNILGDNAQKNLDQGTVLEKMYKYLDNSKGITDEEIAAYKNFSAAMVRYVFAAGKALGQEGNGFSNQDYNNIKNAMFAGKGIEGFEQNLQTFARQRMADATQSAITLRDSGQIQFAKSLGVVFGSDVYTAQEHFENNYKEDAPDYYGWATTVADVAQQPKVKDPPKDGSTFTTEETYNKFLNVYDKADLDYNYSIIANAMRVDGHKEEDIKKVMGENYVLQVETGDE